MRRVHSIAWVLGSVLLLDAPSFAQVLLPPDPAAQVPTQPKVDSGVLTAQATTLSQPANVTATNELPGSSSEPLPAGKPGTLSLEDLEGQALSNNPAVAQAAARVAALRGKCLQVGLPPNPTAGYIASEVGQDNTAGQQGGFVGQEFITGGKLRMNRAVVAQEVQQALQSLEETRFRVRTDVRQAYYAAAIAKRRLELATELMNVGAKSVSESTRLRNLGEIARTDLLPVEIEQRNAQIVAATARAEQDAAWRRLSSVVGVDLPQGDLAGDVAKLPEILTFDDQLSRLTSTSPELAAAAAAVGRSEAALERARREPIPNLQTQFMVQQDNSTGYTISGVTLGIPLPVWNRNQGGIMQSDAELMEARRNVNRVELDLKNRLAVAFQRYAAARERVNIYTNDIVPKAEENFELVRKAYPGQVGSLEFLISQRIYFQTKLSYLDALSDLWSSWSEIDGLLLSNSLGNRVDVGR